MHSVTMDIQEFNSDLEAKEAGYDIPLTKTEYNALQPMNRAQRRAWLKSQRKSGYMPSPKKGK